MRFTRSMPTGVFNCCLKVYSVHPVRVPEVINSSKQVLEHVRGNSKVCSPYTVYVNPVQPFGQS
jgi:hypothetical protein